MEKSKNNIEKIYLLTPMQEGMLFHSIKDKSDAYFDQLFYTASGKIDVDIFSQSIAILSRRHDILRTAFAYEKTERPIQVVLKNRKIDVTILDKTSLKQTDYNHFLEKYKSDDIKKGFDLVKESLIRISIIKRTETVYDFLWSYHHILLDGWCHAILVEELEKIYDSLKNNKVLDLPEPIHFGSYVKWLEKKDASESKNYWKTYLKEYDHIAEVPKVVNRDFSALKNPHYKIKFSKQVSEKIALIVKDYNITQNDVFQTIWGLLLAKYSNSNDVVYGNVVSGRPAELEGADRCLGLFINTIPVRFQYTKEQTLIELAKKSHEGFLEGMPHHYNSLAEIQNETTLKTDLIKHVIAFENYPLSEVNENEEVNQLFKISNIDAFDRTNYDLDVDIELAEEIAVTFYYNANDYHPDYVKKIANSFDVLVHQFVQNPTKKINEISFVSKENIQELLHVFNKNAIDLNNRQPVNVLFENQTVVNRNAVSVIHNNNKWTYKELNTKANKIANTLLENGFKKGNFVGLHLKRSPELIAALLGIFKAGGVYVPLDTQNPTNRTLELLEEGEINALITDNNQLELLVEKNTFSDYLEQVLCINDTMRGQIGGLVLNSKDQIEKNSDKNPKNVNEVTDWAYMLYTSGSTGKPKGAITRYDGAINHILAEFKALNLQDGFCFLQSASIASDISVWQILAPLLKGGSVLIANKEEVLDYKKTLQLMKEYNVTIAEFVPSYLIGFVDYILEQESQKNIVPTLQWMMMVGEEIPVKLVNNWLQLFPNCKVLNGYGPCEASDDITQYEIINKLPEHTLKVSIGKPIDNMNIFVLDDDEKLIPIGVAGEICVSGIGVGAGYFKEPEKTAKSFKPNPFTTTLGETMYKTGDLGRWLPDGNLEFLGRKDRQVKIRGNRVELGEIEAFIRENNFVENVAVVPYKKSSSNISLIAFVINEDKNITTRGQLKIALFEKCAKGLPYYMQPTEYCFVNKIPQNLSDKVDDKKLIAIYKEQTNENKQITQVSTPCITETEKTLKIIWEQILQKTTIGAGDDFFEKGGHSLLAMRVKAAVLKKMKIDLDIRDLFVYTKLNNLAEHIDKKATFNEDDLVISVQEKPEKIPLSFAQESLWFIDNLQGNTTEYNISATIKLKGDLDITLLEHSIKSIIERHETLRSIVKSEGGIPYLNFLNADNWNLNVFSIDTAENNVAYTIEKLISESFNLAIDFKLKAYLLQTETQENILVLVMHHIASDGWSESILVDELITFYNAGINNTPIDLPKLTIQYSDYILWQKKNKHKLEDQISYWKEKLNNAAILNFPTDFERPKVQDTQGDSVDILIDEELLTKLKELSITNGVTLYMTLLAAYKILLYKYAGQKDICVGTPIAGRTNQEIEKLIGYFVNTLTIRSFVNPEIKFNDFLKQIKTTALDAYKNQDAPFEKVVEALVKKRDLSRNPLYQVMFTLQNTPELEEISLGSLDMEFITSDFLQVQADLHFLLEENQDKKELKLEIEYRKSLFNKTTIKRLGVHYKQLLNAIVASPSKLVGKLEILNEEEKNQLVKTFNYSDLKFSKEETIVDVFNLQVIKQPNEVALIHNTETLTYKELNNRANQVAHYLINAGIKKGDLVPICMERSILTVISIFGIIKSGAAYVPIDQTNPLDRISFIIKDSSAKLVVTNLAIIKKIQNCTNINCIAIDGITEKLEILPLENPKNCITQNDLSYVIYTSGTTGLPKGAVMQHKSLISFVEFINQTHPLSLGDKMTFKTNYGFDMAIPEIFGWIKGGASMVIVADEDVKDLNKFLKVLEEQKVTQLNLVPSHLSVFLEYVLANNIKLPFLKYFIVGGEALSINTVRAYQKSLLTASLDNIYGPTETCVFSTFSTVSKMSEEEQIVSIGKPTPNAQIYIVSEELELLPIGVVGELCIGGLGLGKGYLNREELTSTKFIENPYKIGERLYKTGDLAKWSDNGTINYIGRKDSQVKINGYRIELGEVESILNQCSNVKQGVVIVKNLENIGKQLIAYVTTLEKSEVNSNLLQEEMLTKLPEYMVPKTVTILNNFPLNHNGKIDRKSLSETYTLKETALKLVEEQTAMELLLVKVWKNLLGIPSVSINDNFFELGGHSILAMRAIFEIQKELNIAVDVKLLFQSPTIQQLAKELETIDATNEHQKITKIEEANFYETSQAQKRIWLAEQVESNRAVYNIAMAFQMKGDVALEKLKRAINYVIRKHEILRTNFIDIDGIPYQKIQPCKKEQADFKIIHTTDALQTAKTILLEEENYEFNLELDSLIRFRLISNDKENFFIVNLHHIIGDGWSIQTLHEDVLKAYEQIKLTDSLPIENLSVQYKDYTFWHNNQLKKENLKIEEYWLNALSGVEKRLEIPLDKTRGINRDTMSNTLEFSLEKELSLKIKEISSTLGIRKFIVLQALLKSYLAQYMNTTDVVLGTPVAGRNHSQLQDQIGCYINVLALRSQILNEKTFIEVLKQVNIETEEALKNDSYPYDVLVNKLILDRQSTRNPLFDILISYDESNDMESTSSLEFIELKDENIFDNHNKYDITYAFQVEKSGEITIAVKYLTSLFYDSTITAMKDQMITWFQSVLSNPNESLKNNTQSITKEVDLVDDFI